MSTSLAAALGLVVLASTIVKLACDAFEGASDHLGREVYAMPPGVRGATLEAIASSMPELLTTTFLLFLYHDVGGFAAGIATCAGSAVFNAVVIPAACILAVTVKSKSMPRPLPFISLDRGAVLRDGVFFVVAEILLITCLGADRLAWWMGGALLAVYAFYFAWLMRQIRRSGGKGDDPGPDDEDPEEAAEIVEEARLWRSLLTLDWNTLVFGGRPYTTGSAWTVLVLSTATLSGGCYLLAEAVIDSAVALGVPAYFTAVVLGAAATSVPDTFISIGNARKGDYDDAVSNAVGSNIFDICVALGLPILAYGLIHGDLDLAGDAASSDMQALRIVLLVVTAVVLALFLTGARDGSATRVGRGKAAILIGVYLAWTGFVVAQAFV